MSLATSTPCVEIVDDLRLQDIQVTGLSIPILVRMDNRGKTNKEFIVSKASHNPPRFLLQYTQSLSGDSLINLTSVLFQQNTNPVFYYSGDITRRVKVGGEIEDQICWRLSSIYSQVNAPGIIKQLSWLYLFDHKLEFVVPGWRQVPLVHYVLYTISPSQEQPPQPFCEPATKWIFCLRGIVVVQVLSPTPETVAAFRAFLNKEEDRLFGLFQSSATEVRVYRNQVLFIPSGWVYLIRREPSTIEYGGEFFHSFAIETQLGIWHLYEDIYLHRANGISHFLTSHWLVLQAYLFSFQDTMLTTKEDGFSLDTNRDFLPHFTPFECRGMLFLIEIIRSGRMPLLNQCIPSAINCPVSLLQKMQSILLHGSIFSTFSSSAPNGVMFVGTPNLTNVYQSINRENTSKMQPLLRNLSHMSHSKHSSDLSEPESEEENLSVSIQLENVESTSSSVSNYLDVLSEPPNISVPLPHTSSQSSELALTDTSPPNETEKAPLTIRKLLSSLLSESTIETCGICQACRYYNTRPDLKKRKCILNLICDENLLPTVLFHSRPIFWQLIKLLRSYPPLHPNQFLNRIVRKTARLKSVSQPPATPSTLSDIEEVLVPLHTLTHSTPSKL